MPTLITVSGWEERFILGNISILDNYEIDKIILITFKDYLKLGNMVSHRNDLLNECKNKNIEINEIELIYTDSIQNWKVLDSYFKESSLSDNEFLMNLTTIPRETIWTLLFFLKQYVKSINYIYFKPGGYYSDWLTKNHKTPRLLFKHSGIYDLNYELALIVITGFDSLRLNSLIEFLEPHKLIVLTQDGEQFNNNNRNKSFSFYDLETEIININSYDVQMATKTIDRTISKLENYNIIIASQGPKLSSISSYTSYQKSNGKIGLAYVPARDFHSDYSFGIEKTPIEGTLKFRF